MISIRSPTALRIFSNGATALRICSAVMYKPRVSLAGTSKGQIFIADIPLSSKFSASLSAHVMNASKSSNGPALDSTFQLDTGDILFDLTYRYPAQVL